MLKKFFTISSLILIAVFISGCNQPVIPASGQATTTNIPTVPAVATQTATNPPVTKTEPVTKPIEDTPVSSQSLPPSYQLAVTFAQQAPFGNWDALHEEACEEASMIMADKFYKSQPLDESIMETEIQKLIKWENNKGYQVDLTADEAVSVLQIYFGLKAELSSDVTAEHIKTEIFKGHLIIIPAAGRLLGNPNFKGAGPIYHMLVVKGWNDKEFITNDPGTRKGNGYRYSYNTLLNAVHDWDPVLAENGMTDEEMAQGRKVIIIVSR